MSKEILRKCEEVKTMQGILDKLAASAAKRVIEQMKVQNLTEVRHAAEIIVNQEKNNPALVFTKRLQRETLNFICEVKKASPSKGIISKDFPYLEQAKSYEKAGAAAISCLTEPKYFLGSDSYLQEIVQEVKIPVLRKDFILGPYQIYQSKILGASAILLIVGILTKKKLQENLALAKELGVAALVETHTEAEVLTALNAGAEIIGANNRNLQDFTVDINTCVALKKLVPSEKIFVAESGIQNRKDIELLQTAGIHNFLLGETLMRSKNVKETLANLRGEKADKK
jgi:indole-3-glycerol phosphate synthase